MVPTVANVMEDKRLPIISADQSLRKAAEVMLENRVLGTITLDALRRPELVLSYRRLVRAVAAGVDIDKATVAEQAVLKPVTVRTTDSITEALNIMRKRGVRFLPVVDETGEVKGVLEPRFAAYALWSRLSYGLARVEPVSRRIVVLPEDASLRAAAKAMDETGAMEVFVKRGDEITVLREWDFLEALIKGGPEAKIGDYAKGEIIYVPPGFDSKAAVELMHENDVTRLIVKKDGELTTITLTDLAFQAMDYLAYMGERVKGVVLVNVETGREHEVAERIMAVPGVKEVLMATGPFDLIVLLEASSTSELFKIVSEGIRSLRAVKSTQTLVATRVLH
ncbi:CBS domain containing protein [Pyrolobus fumarii 1A]|uniref:CBS domain containing protein n=1 Tax=Pyrolobus fumarii (strain DSM 11204 / 1A) TaxID=694429 RepID=G0ECB3_PYRF1|nr:CBS domain-containing protein [Pyrolobus fumarii]AEM39483.1 CBS domain containing protein [Pyrolobus fumarii 1A]